MATRDYETEVGYTYRIRAAERSGLLKLMPAVYLEKEAEAVSNPTSPPISTSLWPTVAATFNSGDGFSPILESMATRG